MGRSFITHDITRGNHVHLNKAIFIPMVGGSKCFYKVEMTFTRPQILYSLIFVSISFWFKITYRSWDIDLNLKGGGAYKDTLMCQVTVCRCG